jgi:hypothetical protein
MCINCNKLEIKFAKYRILSREVKTFVIFFTNDFK